jgi:hypothetical protein
MPRHRLAGLAIVLIAGVALASAALLAFAGGGTAAASAVPSNSSKPTISGTAQEGKTLDADPGNWSPTPNAYQYDWKRCDSGGSGCSPLANTSQSYTLTSDDVGHRLKVSVSASSDNGGSWSAPVDSSLTSTVTSAGSAPVNTSPPTISGTAQDNQTLTAHNGSWSGSDPKTFSYVWHRCDSSGSNCSGTGGQSSTYRVTSSDVGHRLRVVVTAKNSAGSATATSAATDVALAAGAAPVNTSLPTITGTVQDNSTLTASAGSWTGTAPLTYTYDWRRCDADGNGCNTSVTRSRTTATTAAYRVTSSDTGHRLRVVVTATNAVGTAAATSAPTAVAGAAGTPPRNTALPSIRGTAQDNQTLTAAVGTWTGTAPIAFGYQWYRCDVNGNACAAIGGAAGAAYRVTSSDVGHRLRVTVTARNAAGSIWATSAATSVAAAASTGDGPIRLPNGKTSVSITTLSLPNRLIIDQVVFTPSRIVSRRAPISVRVRVSDSRGNVVRGALVYAVGVPENRVSTAQEVRTAQDGQATISFAPGGAYPFHKGGRLTIYVRARKAGENVLGGVSTRRLVSVGVRPA